MNSSRKFSVGVPANQPGTIPRLLFETTDRSVGSDSVARDLRPRMYDTTSTPRYYSPSSYSIESFEDDNRQPVRTSFTKLLNRKRSVTISTSGSSVKTATNRVTASTVFDAIEDQTLLDGTPQAQSSKSSDTLSTNHSATSLSRMEHAELEPILRPHAPGDLAQQPYEKDLLVAAVSSADSYNSASIFSMSRPLRHKVDGRSNCHAFGGLAPRNKTAPVATFSPPENISTGTEDSFNDLDNDNGMPIPTGPRLIHRSSPPWLVSGCEEACVGQSKAPELRFGPVGQAFASTSQNHQPRQIASQSQSKTGLKKLLKSVKVSLWSTPSASSANELAGQIPDDKYDDYGSQHLSSSNQSSVSDASVDDHSTSTFARSDSNYFNTIDPDESTASLTRSVGACSISTTPSTSITPSSSWSSLPGAQPDYPTRDQPGPHCKGPYSETLIYLDAGRLDKVSNMATPHALACTHPPSRCFESSFGEGTIRNAQDHQGLSARVLKPKPSFGFLQNLKRAVTGVDPTLSFSFHNHLTPSLTTSAVSLPIGTVLRNNGLDPLPPCHPLPLKSSQSSPSNLECCLLASTRSEAPRFESVPSTRAKSLFSSGLEECSNIRQSTPSHPHDESIPQPEALRVPPTLNLRPVSMPFAAGFSDQFLFGGFSSTDSQEQNPASQPQEELDAESTDAHAYCSCCRSLAEENVKLRNRIKELELMVSYNVCST